MVQCSATGSACAQVAHACMCAYRCVMLCVFSRDRGKRADVAIRRIQPSYEAVALYGTIGRVGGMVQRVCRATAFAGRGQEEG